MLDKLSGYATDIRNWERRLKDMDSKKANPTKVKEIQDVINNLKSLLKEKQEKREQRKKDKEQKAAETSKEEVKVEAAPETPTDKVEHDPKVAPHLIVPDSLKEHEKTVEHVEHSPEVAPHLISEQQQPVKGSLKIDDKVEPIRGGTGSWGHVMRESGVNGDPLVYVKWMEGPLKEKHGEYGGYYEHDLKKKSEEAAPKSEHPCPCYEDKTVYCPKCKSVKTSDLKTKYEDMLKELKDELEEAKQKHDHLWISKLELKVKELETKIAEKFGNEKEADNHSRCSDNSGTSHAGPMIEHNHGSDKPTMYCDKHLPSHIEYNTPEPKSKEAGAQNAEQLTIIDHSIPRPNKTRDEGGKDGDDEFQDLWAGPAGTEVSSSLKKATQINVFNKTWSATPVTKNNKLAYEITDNSGKKVLSLSPLNGQEMNAEHLKWAIQREITSNFKQATLKEDIAFLKKGSKVYILASDKAKGRLKFADLNEGVRGWAPASKFKILAAVGETMKHGDHVDEVLGHREHEKLVDCPMGSGNVKWVALNELLPTNPPPATPESLNDLESAKVNNPSYKCPTCGKSTYFKSAEGWRPFCSEECARKGTATKESAKDCPDCHGTFVGQENETCPTCGRFSVEKTSSKDPRVCNCNHSYSDHTLSDRPMSQSRDCERCGCINFKEKKEALKTALPPVIPNQRGYLNNPPPVDKKAGPKLCAYCATSYPTFEEYQQHMKEKHSHPKPVTCPDCGAHVEDLKQLEQHRVEKHKQPVNASEEETLDFDEPSEEDIFIQDDKGDTIAANQHVGIIAKLSAFDGDWELFYTQIRDWMESKSWFPSVWEVSDHGNIHLDTDWIKWMNTHKWKTSSLNKQAHIRHENGKWVVYNHDYTKRLGEYDSKSSAEKRLRQIEFWKRQGSLRPFSKKADYVDPEWTTKKVGEFFDEIVAEKFMMDNHLENGFYRKEGNKYVVYTDVPISSMASKKAEVLTDPYQSLTDHITDMKSRMSQVQEKLQSAPLPKQAGEEDNSKLDLPELFEDLTMGIDLLETKLKDAPESEELHKGLEQLENLLWEVEMKAGVKPEIPEHEKEEPEHKELVKEVEKEAASSGSVTTTITSPSVVMPAAPNSTPQSDDAPSNAPDDASPSCALCGGLTFADYAGYQNHMEYTHKSDTMPTSPSQKLQPTNVTSDKKVAVVTDETIDETITNDPNAIPATTTTTPAPVIQNVQPTDDDNLEVSVVKPSSPPAPGQIWVFNPDVHAYVSMPDPAAPNKTI